MHSFYFFPSLFRVNAYETTSRDVLPVTPDKTSNDNANGAFDAFPPLSPLTSDRDRAATRASPHASLPPQPVYVKMQLTLTPKFWSGANGGVLGCVLNSYPECKQPDSDLVLTPFSALQHLQRQATTSWMSGVGCVRQIFKVVAVAIDTSTRRHT
jgi:hypothetical protein